MAMRHTSAEQISCLCGLSKAHLIKDIKTLEAAAVSSHGRLPDNMGQHSLCMDSPALEGAISTDMDNPTV